MTQRTITYLSMSLFALLVLWGGYTLLVYIGSPVHQLVYMQQDALKAIDASCGSGQDLATGTLLCRGFETLPSFVLGIVYMGSPFFAYALISLILLGIFLAYRGYKTGYFSADIDVRPVACIGAFALAVWLLATTLSLGSFNNLNAKEATPFRTFYEPTAEVYSNAKPEALAILQKNYESLLADGCLTQVQETQGHTKIYTLSEWCIQKSIFSRVGSQFVMLLLFTLNLLVAGSLLLNVLRLKIKPGLLETIAALGSGALLWVGAIWLLAIAGELKMTVVRILFFGFPFVAFPVSWYWLKAAWERKVSLSFSLKNVGVLLGWLLLSYLALNFLNVVRPFPIGWDDLGSYLNRPRLLASYGSFIPSMSQFQWEYLTSLGFVLFGYDSWFGATFAMQINWIAGLFAVLTVYAFARLFLGKRAGFLAAILYYFLPMTGHFSFADMKIDNASFFVSALAILSAFVALFGTPGLEGERRIEPGDRRFLALSGVLAGFAFGIKPTAILTVLMIVTVLTGEAFGVIGMIGATFVSLLVLYQFGPLSFTAIATQVGGLIVPPNLIPLLLLILAIGCLFIALRKSPSLLRPTVNKLVLFSVAFIVSILPWTAYNGISKKLHGDSMVSLSALLSTGDYASPQIYYTPKNETPPPPDSATPVRYLPAELKLDPQNPACTTSAKTEELDRYWGFGTNWSHYLTLPWREVMNSDAVGYYVTLMPALLLLPLLLLLPFFWSKEGRWLRFLFAGSMIFLGQWIFVGNGIMWYGIAMFLGFAVCLEAMAYRAPDVLNRWAVSILLTLSIFVCLLNRFWQFDSQRNLFEYPLGKINAEALQEMTIPDYGIVRESVVQRHQTMTGRPYTYRIGTFISYFIPQNREILPLADHQLNFFSCLNQERNHALTLKRLQALGFNSMIFDTNTQTIERDPNGSLHQKVQGFLDFANDPTINVKPVINDPGNGIAYLLLP